MAKKKAEAVEEIKEVAAETVVEETPKKSTKKSTKKVEAPVEEIPAAEPEVVEEVKVEEPVKKKASKKKAEPVEEVKVEEPAAEPELVAEPVVEETQEEYPVVKYGNGMISFPAHDVEEVNPEPVKEEKKPAKKAEPKASGSYQAIAKNSLYVLKVPGKLNTKLGSFQAGIKFTILEEDRGWGKIAEGKWINLNYVEKI